MLKVYIVGGSGQGYGRMFEAAGWELARGPLKADLIQFTGGEDVSPSLYGEVRHPYTGDNLERDLYEAGYFAFAKRMGTPMAGICRGGQFLNVMSGGSMYQHVSAHATGTRHNLTSWLRGAMEPKTVSVSSTHHQMMRPWGNYVLLGDAQLGGFKERMSGDLVVKCQDPDESDTEVVYYPATKALCFQPHPEFFQPGDECFEYYFDCIERVHGLRA